MKKILAIVITFVLAFTLFACGESAEESTVSTESKTHTSSQDSSQNDSSPASSTDSSEAEVSEGEQVQLPDYIPNYVSFAPLAVSLRATDSTSIRLTKINQSAGYGDIVLYTRDFGAKIHVSEGNYDDYAVMVCEYSHTHFGYVKTALYPVDDNSVNKADIDIPRDGFILVGHYAHDSMVGRFGKFDGITPLYVNGIQIADTGFSIKKTASPITIDGVLDSEWNNYKIDHIDENNILWKYSAFEKDNYYTTADYYISYDKDYLYMAVVVNSPYHYCPITPETASSMWKYECIQVKVVDQSPLSDFMLQHFDHIIDNTAVSEGHVRSYGFAVNNEGVTCYYQSGIKTEFGGMARVVRDNNAQTTTYEVAIPLAEFGIDVTQTQQIGVTFSINSTNEDDITTGNWRNLILREGGGVIGRNDWTKIPVVTLVP